MVQMPLGGLREVFGVLLLVVCQGCIQSAAPGEVQNLKALESDGVSWATGFGFKDAGRVLWVTDGEGSDTVHWVKEGRGQWPTGEGYILPASPLRLATWSTTHVPLVLALGVDQQWVASGYLDRVRPLADTVQGSCLNLGGDAGISEETLLASQADVLTSYPFGDPMEGVESRTGVPVLAMAEYVEAHPLGRAEYVKLFGWLLDQSGRADSVFQAIEGRYLKQVQLALEGSEKTGRPSVFTGSFSGGQWTAPTERGLVARMIQDAGGHYVFDAQTAADYGLRQVGNNYEVEPEQCALIAEGCEAWGRVVYAPSGWSMADVQAEAPWCNFSGKTVFHCNTAEVDYFGTAILEPDRMLKDLLSVLHPDLAKPSASPYFQRTGTTE